MGIGIDDSANKHYNLQINCILNNLKSCELVNSYVIQCRHVFPNFFDYDLQEN